MELTEKQRAIIAIVMATPDPVVKTGYAHTVTCAGEPGRHLNYQYLVSGFRAHRDANALDELPAKAIVVGPRWQARKKGLLEIARRRIQLKLKEKLSIARHRA